MLLALSVEGPLLRLFETALGRHEDKARRRPSQGETRPSLLEVAALELARPRQTPLVPIRPKRTSHKIDRF